MAKRRVNKYLEVSRKMALERMWGCENAAALAGELEIDRAESYSGEWVHPIPL